MIGGIDIFLPSSPIKASAHIVGAEEGQPVETIVKEKKEHTLIFFPREEGRGEFKLDAHSVGERLEVVG